MPEKSKSGKHQPVIHIPCTMFRFNVSAVASFQPRSKTDCRPSCIGRALYRQDDGLQVVYLDRSEFAFWSQIHTRSGVKVCGMDLFLPKRALIPAIVPSAKPYSSQILLPSVVYRRHWLCILLQKRPNLLPISIVITFFMSGTDAEMTEPTTEANAKCQ
jgi:hypothetical protein